MTCPHEPRLLIYSQDGFGLGHQRRTTLLANEFLARRPGASVLTVSDSPLGKFFKSAAGHDYCKLPSVQKVGPGDWRPQVVRAVAARAEGIDEIVAAIDKHREWMERTGALLRRREHRAAAEIEAIALGVLRERIGTLRDGTALAGLAERVAAGGLDPYAAAGQLLATLQR